MAGYGCPVSTCRSEDGLCLVHYTAINRNQAALGLPPLHYPPERREFSPNPAVGFRMTVRRGRLALKLTASKAPL